MGTLDGGLVRLERSLVAGAAFFSLVACTSSDARSLDSVEGSSPGTGGATAGSSDLPVTGGANASPTGGAPAADPGGPSVAGGTSGNGHGGTGDGGEGARTVTGGEWSGGAGGSAGEPPSGAGAVTNGGMPAVGGGAVTAPIVAILTCADGEDPTACLPETQQFTRPNDVSLLAAAGLEDEGALLLRESVDEGNGEYSVRAMLQRIDGTGKVIGEAVEISAPREIASIIRTSIVGDGERYLYCLSSQTEVTCGMFQPPLVHTPHVFDVEGESVSVAFTRDTWLVAYRTLPSDPDPATSEPVEVVLQTFSRDGLKKGSTLRLSMLGMRPILTATDTEFVMVAPYAEQGFDTHVFWLTPELEMARAPVALEEKAAVGVVVAATPDLVAVSSTIAYHSVLSLLGPTTPARTHIFKGGGKLGAYHALTATPGAVTASWFTDASRLIATTFSSPDQVPPELVIEDYAWASLRVGERILGARILGGFGISPSLEVLPLPMPSESAEQQSATR